MKLAASLPLTLCDFPGKVAAMVFTQGCNFRCPWCHNAHLIPADGGTPTLETGTVLNQIADRGQHGLIEGIVISGGEPTLHPGLPGFLERCKAAGLLVKLDTNGSRPEVLEACLKARLLDSVAMDIKAPWPRYAELAGTPVDTEALRASVRILSASGIAHQFRTTRVEPPLTAEDYTAIVTQIPAGSPHVWQTYRPV